MDEIKQPQPEKVEQQQTNNKPIPTEKTRAMNLMGLKHDDPYSTKREIDYNDEEYNNKWSWDNAGINKFPKTKKLLSYGPENNNFMTPKNTFRSSLEVQNNDKYLKDLIRNKLKDNYIDKDNEEIENFVNEYPQIFRNWKNNIDNNYGGYSFENDVEDEKIAKDRYAQNLANVQKTQQVFYDRYGDPYLVRDGKRYGLLPNQDGSIGSGLYYEDFPEDSQEYQNIPEEMTYLKEFPRKNRRN